MGISWINDTSAYIGVKKDQNKKVQKQLMKNNAVYKLQTYEEFRSLRKNENESSISTDDVLGRFKNGSKSNSSPKNDDDSNKSTSNSDKKRTTQEDIGEIIARPQKKKCSFETPPFES